MKKKQRRKRKTKDEFITTDWIKYLWPIFSRYIRIRDCITTTGKSNFGACCTCGKVYPIKRLQAGHFIPGRTNAILFDADQVHAQCYRCNVQRSGMWHMYYLFMLRKGGHTHESIQDMIAHVDDEVEFTPEWFRESAAWYEAEIERMLEGK